MSGLDKKFSLYLELTENEIRMLNFMVNRCQDAWDKNPDWKRENPKDYGDFSRVADTISDFIHANGLCKDPECDDNAIVNQTDEAT